MDYRLYKPDDFAAIYAVEEVCFHPPFRFGRRYLQWLVNASNSTTWIAEEAETLAGFGVMEWTPSIRGLSAYIQTIEVLPAHRGKGAGRELLTRLESSAHDAGAITLWLHVDASNATAIGLYESRGFLRVGEEKNYYAAGRDALIYRKELDSRETRGLT
jgi:ribosomal protein S18 acetylase RimI-like enzyme